MVAGNISSNAAGNLIKALFGAAWFHLHHQAQPHEAEHDVQESKLSAVHKDSVGYHGRLFVNVQKWLSVNSHKACMVFLVFFSFLSNTILA